MSELVPVAFASPDGDEIRFEWSTEALAALDPSGGDPPWRLAGGLDWERIEAVRTLAARLDDGRALAITAIRPAGAAGHGEEVVSGLLVAEGEVEQLDEALVSVEHGRDGAVLRVGLELHRAETAMPVRVAADASGFESRTEEGVRHDRAALAVRAQGSTGVGIYELMRRQ